MTSVLLGVIWLLIVFSGLVMVGEGSNDEAP
ncbi:hypothetical protein O77CONTIG1_01658 [Leptolyngbya sp. O-77]|nr:hypothetical protein O77CONTIG1_01658 [Leptolyngbya sp. O-77]